ncbi:tetratricopeptide repeat protein [Microbispora sp. NPDC049125]|uniref:tetratricopeptide repeat protein n=1 Tax=Microbispora sp. NPDC049125 TaxID=3154929 RepID=UPI0034677B4D
MQPARHSLGSLIRQRRLSSGLSQGELAILAGVSARSLRDIEADRVARPRASSLHRLASALGLTGDDLRALLETVRPAARPVDAVPFHIGVLGPLVIRDGDRPVEIRSATRRDLLGLLALQPGQRVPRDELVDVLWGDRPPRTYAAMVQGHVAALRGLLQPERRRRPAASIVTLERGGYMLETVPGALDLAEFDDLVRRARDTRATADRRAALDLSDQALRLWRGPVLADTGSRLRHHPLSAALNQRRMAAALAFADSALVNGSFSIAADHLRRLAADEPLHEGLHARLILAMAGGGDQAGALRLFADLRRRLAEELGVEPGPELRAAHLRVLRQELPVPGSAAPDTLPAVLGAVALPEAAHTAPGAEQERGGGLLTGTGHPSAAAPSQTRAEAVAVPAQLPLDARGFAGRTAELARLDAHLAAVGHSPTALTILVVSGTAGVGKTTLALHWAHRVRDRFPDGQLYLNLRGFDPAAAAIEPAEAIRSFLDALGVPPHRVPPGFEAQTGLYRSLLANRRILVVLDNARDVEQVRPLLPGSPSCLVVVTSRDQMSGLVAIEGGCPLTLGLLSTSEGRELVVRRLGAERPGAEPRAVDEIIAQCAGLPLALAVVTARAVMNPRFSLASLAGELRAVQGGLDAFHGGDPATQVRTVFSWSYRTLSAEAARLFRLLALHPGPDIGVNAAVCLAGVTEDRVRPLLAELSRAHLISEHVAGRYTFHDLLRLYAAERNREEDGEAERAAATQRLYDHYVQATYAAARTLYPNMIRLPSTVPAAGLDPAGHGGALAWLDAEHPNLVAAVTHAAEYGQRPAAWRLADGLRGYFARRRHSVHWFAVAEAGLAAARAESDLQAQAALHLSTAHAYNIMANRQEALAHLGRALDMSRRAGWREGQAVALTNTGSVQMDLGRLEEAGASLLSSLDLSRQGGDDGSDVMTHNNLGELERMRGRLRAATRHLDRAMEKGRRLGVSAGLVTTLETTGQVHYDLGHLASSAAYLNRALRFARLIGDDANRVNSLVFLSYIHRDAGRLIEAVECARVALRLSEDLTYRHRDCAGHNALAACYHDLGRHAEAIDHYRSGLRLAQEAAIRYSESEALVGLALVNTRIGNHDEARGFAHDALALARQADFRVREGQVLTVLAETHLREGDHAEAAEHARHAIDLHRETGHRLGEARALTLLGTASHRLHGPGSALCHWGEALALFTDIGTPEAGRLRELIGGSGDAAPGVPRP